MKRLITLLILFVVAVSLCSELPFSLPEIPTGTSQGAATIDSGSPDIYVNVETLASEIKSGRSMQLFFELGNKQLYDLTNVYFEVYDHPCFNIASNNFSYNCKDGTLRSNETCSWSWRWDSDTEGSNADRTCQIKFLVSYSATNSIFQDIAVLSETEYNQRETAGTLNSIPIQFNSAKGPLQVYLTFSEPQPFIADQSGYSMFINYNNAGDGLFADETNDIDIRLNVSDNIKDLSCGDQYTGSFPNFQLNKDKPLKFIKGRSVPTICSFSTSSDVSTMSIRSLNIEIGYKYTLYGSFPIIVRGS